MGSPRIATLVLSGLLLAGAAPRASAEQRVVELRGSASRITPEFEVRAPWILDWRVTTENDYEAAVDVSLERAGTGVHVGNVLQTKRPGNGVRLFTESGRFYFRVNSLFSGWTLKVIELTEEEARAYTPKNERPLTDF